MINTTSHPLNTDNYYDEEFHANHGHWKMIGTTVRTYDHHFDEIDETPIRKEK